MLTSCNLDDGTAVIVTGWTNQPDRRSRTGWMATPYARLASPDDVGPRETVWSGTMHWSHADAENGTDAGWMGPHGLRIADPERAAWLAHAAPEIDRLTAAMRTPLVWSEVAGEWIAGPAPAGLDDQIAALQAWLAEVEVVTSPWDYQVPDRSQQ